MPISTTSPLQVRMPSGEVLTFANASQLSQFYQKHAAASQMAGALPSGVRESLRTEAGRLQKYVQEELPAQRADMVKIIEEGKRDSFLGKIGAYMESVMSTVDTAAEAGKLAPNPVAQVASRTWLGSTAATKAAMSVLQGEQAEAGESGLKAVSQIPGLGMLGAPGNLLGTYNKGTEAVDAVQGGRLQEGAGLITEALGNAAGAVPGKGMELAGSAVQMAGTYVRSDAAIDEMNHVAKSLDGNLAKFDEMTQQITERFNQKAQNLQELAALADAADATNSKAVMEAILSQLPELADQLQAEASGVEDAALKQARDTAITTLQRQDPEAAKAYLDSIRAAGEEKIADLTPDYGKYWFDPDDKNGFVNIVPPGGKYTRMSVEDAVKLGLVPEGTSLENTTLYRDKTKEFLNGIDTVGRSRGGVPAVPDNGGGDGSGGAVSGGEGIPAGSATTLTELATNAGKLCGEIDEAQGRAMESAKRAAAAARRARAARAYAQAMLRKGGCWVARRVFGEADPRWRLFRCWLLTEAPVLLRAVYLRHGEAFARRLRPGTLLHAALKRWMSAVAAKHGRRLAAGDLPAKSLRRSHFWFGKD